MFRLRQALRVRLEQPEVASPGTTVSSTSHVLQLLSTTVATLIYSYSHSY